MGVILKSYTYANQLDVILSDSDASHAQFTLVVKVGKNSHLKSATIGYIASCEARSGVYIYKLYQPESGKQ